MDLKNSMLNNSEYVYIKEYLTSVGPIAEALNVFRGENNIFYGFVFHAYKLFYKH